MEFTLTWNQEVLLRPTLFNSVAIVLILAIFFIICGMKMKKADPAKPPKGLVFLLEYFVTFVENFVIGVMGEKNLKFAPYIGMLMVYLAVANLIGLLGLTPPTTDYNVTLALAIMTIVLMIGSGIKVKGVGSYLRDTYLGNIPVLLPLNIMSELSKPISLSFRLFGNILSGTIILAVAVESLGWISLVIFPFFNAYFDIFAGLIQTMIFCMLTMIWSHGAME